MTPKTQEFYYTDSCFQLEINLQAVRLALIKLLEESEDGECFVCNRLRCRCDSVSLRSSTLSDPGFSYSELSSASSLASDLDFILITAPPADSLPMPVWQVSKSHRSSPDFEDYFKDIEKWVRASTPNMDGTNRKIPLNSEINSEVNCSWPPAPSSIWNDSLPSVSESPVDVVDAFFRYFAKSAQRGSSYF